jgi:mRNA-degrading endonuclease RelE of RelBE toxin-antitoxin system
VKWQLVYTKQAQRDAKKLAASGHRSKTESLLATVTVNPFKIHLPMRSWSAI